MTPKKVFPGLVLHAPAGHTGGEATDNCLTVGAARLKICAWLYNELFTFIALVFQSAPVSHFENFPGYQPLSWE